MWQAKYQPRYALSFIRRVHGDGLCYYCRNHVPWIVIGICYVICPAILYVIRVMLARENKLRDSEPLDDTYDNVFIQHIDEDGSIVEKRVDKVSKHD